jgi:hypothetical protein
MLATILKMLTKNVGNTHKHVDEKMSATLPKNVDEKISTFPKNVDWEQFKK